LRFFEFPFEVKPLQKKFFPLNSAFLQLSRQLFVLVHALVQFGLLSGEELSGVFESFAFQLEVGEIAQHLLAYRHSNPSG